MRNYKRIPTTYDVFKAITTNHSSDDKFHVFSSCSEPDGGYGSPDKCRMMTEYGFSGCDCPVVGAETTWEKNPEDEYDRINQKYSYWLCSKIENDNY